MKQITVTVADLTLVAELNDSSTAQAIWDALPIETDGIRWGDEIYFEVPVMVLQEDEARAEVKIGELAYWPLGHAFCIFFGPTPVSTDGQPRAYSPVNVFGHVLDDATVLRSVPTGAPVMVERNDLDS